MLRYFWHWFIRYDFSTVRGWSVETLLFISVLEWEENSIPSPALNHSCKVWKYFTAIFLREQRAERTCLHVHSATAAIMRKLAEQVFKMRRATSRADTLACLFCDCRDNEKNLQSKFLKWGEQRAERTCSHVHSATAAIGGRLVWKCCGLHWFFYTVF